MKKIFLICFLAALIALCCLFSACSIFGNKPDNPDKPDDGNTVYKLEELSIGAKSFTFIYDGKPKTFEVTLNKGSEVVATVKPDETHPDLALDFADNVEVGRGTVTVKAKSGAKKFSGSVCTTFEIKLNDSRVDAGDFAALRQYLAGGTYGNVCLTADVEIPQNEKITIPNKVKLDMGEHSIINYGEFVVCGELTVGSLSMWDDSAYDVLNYGKFITERGSSIVFKVHGGIVNCGQFEHNGSFRKHESNFRENYVYSDSELNFSSQQDVIVRIRKSINNADVTLQNAEITYTGKPIVPSLADSQKDVDYTVDCENNVNVGTVNATFTATPHSRYYFGQRTFQFRIIPAPYQTQNKDSFTEALKNANYSPVTFEPQYKTYLSLDVLPNVTVNVSKCSILSLSLANNSVLNVYGNDCNIGSSGNAALGNDAEINVYGSAVIYGDVTGSGKINVLQDGELFFFNTVKSVDAAIFNEGAVYSDFHLSNVTGNGSRTVRRQLEESELTAEKLDYTGQDLQVVAKFVHSEEKNYSVAYRSGDEYTASAYPKERGEYRARLRFGEKNKYYFGTVEFGFTVSKGSIAVKDADDLLNRQAEGNYDRYEINEWRIGSSTHSAFTIAEDETVTVKTVINNGNLTVRGTLSVLNCTNYTDGVLTVANGGLLKLRGNLSNFDETASLVFEQGANFQNIGSGAVYLCCSDIPAVTGQKYIRTSNLADSVFSNVEEAIYGVNHSPKFDLALGSVTVPQSDLDVTYSGNSERTTENGATIKASAKTNSEIYYGAAVCKFTVLGGTKTVKTDGELLAALNDKTSNGLLCNWARIETGKEIELKENSQNGKVDDYRIPEGTTFVINHNISYWRTVPDMDKFLFGNNGVVEFHNGASIKDADLWQKNGTGVFKLFAVSKFDFNKIGVYFDYIRLENNLDVTDSSLSVYARGDMVWDLNNCDIGGLNSTLSLYTNGHTVTVRGAGRIASVLDVSQSTSGQVVLENVVCDTVKDPNGIVVRR